MKRKDHANKTYEVNFIRASKLLKQKSRFIPHLPAFQNRFELSKDVFTQQKMQDEYRRAQLLQKRLLKKFRGTLLETAIPGHAISNNYGEVYRITGEYISNFKRPISEKSIAIILSNLKLVSGIGPVWEKRLQQNGFKSIEDLVEHHRWSSQAKKILSMLETKQVGALQEWLGRILPKSHPIAHCLAGLCNDEEFLIVDIETLGLFGGAIILIGLAKPTKQRTYVTQYLLRSVKDEASALWEFDSHLTRKSALITFNGRSFDVPYLEHRMSYYSLNSSIDNPHFDLLHFARRAWRNLPNRRLETLEKYLGIHRKVDIPGSLVPEFYDTYRKTKNVGPLVAIVEHNKQDLLTLATLFTKLCDIWEL